MLSVSRLQVFFSSLLYLPPWYFSSFCLLQIPSPNFSLKPPLLLSLLSSYLCLPHFLSPVLSISVCHILLPLLLILYLALSIPAQAWLPQPGRIEGQGLRPQAPPSSCSGENGLAGKGRRRGRGRWEHTGSVGPFKGSFMGWREAETKRPRRRDTARASLGGDTQTEQAGGNQARGERWGVGDPNGPPRSPFHRPGLAPTWLSPGAVVPPSRVPSRGRTCFGKGAAVLSPRGPAGPAPARSASPGGGRGSP